MQRLIYGIILLLHTATYAETIHADFDVSYGIFGKIGTAKAVLTKEPKFYSIDIRLEATGLARLLSSGRKEHHISKGHIENGMMISDLYQVMKSHGDVLVNKAYHSDHKKKIIQKSYSKHHKGKVVKKEFDTLDFYSKDDLLTLYFNLDKAIQDKHKYGTYNFKAVGAERQKGKVSVVIPKKVEYSKYIEVLGTDAAWYATAIIHQKIFSSKEGRLMLAVGKDGITNKAVLKDVIFFGDIVAVRSALK